jgi:hypothetical protein
MELGDVVTTALVLLALWTFVPRQLRRVVREGLEPTVAALAHQICVAARAAAKVLTHLAYRVIVGQVPVEPLTSSEEDRSPFQSVQPVPVRPDTGAERTGSAIAEPVRPTEPPESHDDITDDEVIAALATVCKPNGEYRFSANAIAALVGGTRSEVLEQIKRHRLPAGPQFRQEDGTAVAPTYPVSGRTRTNENVIK